MLTKFISTVACAAVITSLSVASAQVTFKKPIIGKPKPPITTITETVFPALETIYGHDPVAACNTFDPNRFGPIFKQGVTPARSGKSNPYGHLMPGPTKLQLSGFRMDRIVKAEFQMPTGPAIPVTVGQRIASASSSCSHLGTGKGVVELQFNIPDVSSVSNGVLVLYAHKEPKILTSLQKIDKGKQCFLEGEVRVPIPCPTAQPVGFKVVDLIIHPKPSFRTPTPTSFFASGPTVSGTSTFAGSNLSEVRLLGPANGNVRVGVISTASTQLRAAMSATLNTPGRVQAQVTPVMPLLRGAGIQNVNVLDTMAVSTTTNTEAARTYLPRFTFTFTRTAPPAARVRLEGHDPGNILYLNGGGGSTSDRDGNVYIDLNSQNHCQSIQPPPVAAGPLTAVRREVTIPDIRWGVRNAGNTVANGNFTAELRQRSSTGPVVATFNFANLAAGATLIAPQPYNRPDSSNTVAVLSDGPKCRHAGLVSDGWNDNDGWFITVRGVSGSVKRITSN